MKMEARIFLGLIVMFSVAHSALGVSCYTCMRMEVSGGSSYGPALCKEHGLDYMEDDNADAAICQRSTWLPAYQTYYDREKAWSTILGANDASQYTDWSCHKSEFKITSPESSTEIKVYYRGCQPIKLSTNAGRCTEDLMSNVRDLSTFQDVYANVTATDRSRARLEDGEECLCSFFQCNAASQSQAAALLTTLVTIATLALVILI